MLTDRFEQALVYAAQVHAKQVRKGTTIPYVSHLLAVTSLTLEHGGDEDQAIGALLHDAAEDQGGEERLSEIRARFGPEVAAIVADCTDSWTDPKPPWRERKELYLAGLAAKSPRSLLVSLADKTHNARSILMDLRVHGDALWTRFTGGREGVVWYYSSLAQVFASALPSPLADELGRTAGTIAKAG